MPVRLTLGLALATLVAAAATPRAAAQDTFDDVPRIVAVGDVHGGYDQLVAVLRGTGLVDGRNRWIGGRAHLVQTGDVVDRGADSRKVMDLLMALEKQAQRAGGRVHALIGNHEVMNLIGDLRYVSPAEYEAFRSDNAVAMRERAFELLADPVRRTEQAYRRQWNADHPLGWVEHRQAFGPKGDYGKWIRGHNTVVRVNDVLFLHGGISPKYASLPIREINDRARAELADFTRIEGGMLTDPDGPLWYRGLAADGSPEILAHVEQLLQTHSVRRIALGHTIAAPVVLPRFEGRVILLDVGLSPAYGGPAAGLVIEGGSLSTWHRGQRVALPTDGNVRAYLERVAAIDPPPSPILKVIEGLAPAAPAGIRQPR
jgi:hypothetical protein